MGPAASSLWCFRASFAYASCRLIPGKPLADNLAYSQVETLAILHPSLGRVVGLFIEVTEQVKWFDRNIGAIPPTFRH
jgi:hypothetical protein